MGQQFSSCFGSEPKKKPTVRFEQVGTEVPNVSQNETYQHNLEDFFPPDKWSLMVNIPDSGSTKRTFLCIYCINKINEYQ